jgi:O-acetyl-ADP-ribose deacetylase (regulator of RNase III)
MEPKILAEQAVGNCVFQAVLGDMTAEEVDAIVNAANTHLAHGGGLAGAIVARGGIVIQHESDRIAPIATGEAAITTAGALPCRWIIHAVGPIWGRGEEEKLLRAAVRASLDRGAELQARSIAMPAISTGIFGYPTKDGTATIIDESRSWILDHHDSPLHTLRFTAFDHETAGFFASGVLALATFMPDSAV